MDNYFQIIFKFSISILLISLLCVFITDRNSPEFIASVISTSLAFIVFIITYLSIRINSRKKGERK